MSSLTDEQRRRIEENRARALAKLAEKKKSPVGKPISTTASLTSVGRQQSSSHHVNSSERLRKTSFYTSHSNGHSSKQKTITDGGLFAEFQYHRKNKPTTNNNVSSTSNLASSNWINKTAKTVNNAIKKKITATCVLTDKEKFKVVVALHSGLIGIFKTLSSGCYGTFLEGGVINRMCMEYTGTKETLDYFGLASQQMLEIHILARLRNLGTMGSELEVEKWSPLPSH